MSLTEDYLRKCTVGELAPSDSPIVLLEYDSQWPERFRRESENIRTALGEQALRIEHVGSTSVPGLIAKPIIDIVLVVRDSSEESAYAPQLERAGYRLRVREPDWYEHRMFKSTGDNVNLHVFSESCLEIDRMVVFRDRLRTQPRRSRCVCLR